MRLAQAGAGRRSGLHDQAPLQLQVRDARRRGRQHRRAPAAPGQSAQPADVQPGHGAVLQRLHRRPRRSVRADVAGRAVELQHRQLEVRRPIRDLDEQSGRRSAVQLRRPATVDWTQYTPPFSAANNGTSASTTARRSRPASLRMPGAATRTSTAPSSRRTSSSPRPRTRSRSRRRCSAPSCVAAQNMSNFDKTFRLVIQNQPPGGWASFKAGTNVPAAPRRRPS